MEFLPSAARHRVEPEDIQHALVNAVVIEEIGDDPLKYLVLGPDRSARFLELVVLDTPGTGSAPRDVDAHAIREVPDKKAMTMAKDYGAKLDGTPVTSEMIEAMADEAEQGYDVDSIRARRQGGRPPIGSTAASVESVRLDPELKRDLLLRAAQDGTSMSELIRTALRQYIQAS